jgi:hypothetical protein
VLIGYFGGIEYFVIIPMSKKIKETTILVIFFILVAIYNIYFGGAGSCETKIFWWDKLWC